MSDVFNVAFDLALTDGWVVREGKLFEAGEYPDKGLAVTAADLAAAVAGFAPVPVDLEHVPTLLDGKLGELRSVRVAEDGRTLVGSVALPRWLNDALGSEPVKVSTTWDRLTKKLMGLALVRHPRVSDAALMSAYATFVASQTPPPAPAGGGSEKERNMNESRFKRFVRWLSGEGEEAAFALDDGATVETTMPLSPAPASGDVIDPSAAAPDAEVERLRAALAAERASRIQGEAVAFADGEIAAQRAYPAEREVMVAAYVQAAQEDLAVPWPAQFAVNRATSRVALLRAQYGARPAHSLTSELVGGETVLPSDPAPKSPGMTAERRLELLNKTYIGRAVAQKE